MAITAAVLAAPFVVGGAVNSLENADSDRNLIKNELNANREKENKLLEEEKKRQQNKDSQIQSEEERTRQQRLKRSQTAQNQGRRSTILTGALGLKDEPELGRKTLLGF